MHPVDAVDVRASTVQSRTGLSKVLNDEGLGEASECESLSGLQLLGLVHGQALSIDKGAGCLQGAREVGLAIKQLCRKSPVNLQAASGGQTQHRVNRWTLRVMQEQWGGVSASTCSPIQATRRHAPTAGRSDKPSRYRGGRWQRGSWSTGRYPNGYPPFLPPCTRASVSLHERMQRSVLTAGDATIKRSGCGVKSWPKQRAPPELTCDR